MHGVSKSRLPLQKVRGEFRLQFRAMLILLGKAARPGRRHIRQSRQKPCVGELQAADLERPVWQRHEGDLDAATTSKHHSCCEGQGLTQFGAAIPEVADSWSDPC